MRHWIVLFLMTISAGRFPGFGKICLLRKWQGKSEATENGRFAHSILLKVSLWPWFEGKKKDIKFVYTVSRIMYGHCAARSHLSKFKIIEKGMFVWLKDYEKVDHLIWHCREASPNRCTHCTWCATYRPKFVCSEEVAGYEVLSGFLLKSWN
jgi:hypothetical protein